MILIKHRQARFLYKIEEQYLAGLVLTGPEVKSLRNKSGSLTGSFVRMINEEAFLINAQISPYAFADNKDYDPKRTRKLLLSKRELRSLQVATHQKNRSLVPLSFELVGKHIKLRFGVGIGLKKHQKRAKLRERDQQRDMEKDLKKRWR